MRTDEIMGKPVRVTIGPDVFFGVVIGVVGDDNDRTMGEVEYVTVCQLTPEQEVSGSASSHCPRLSSSRKV